MDGHDHRSKLIYDDSHSIGKRSTEAKMELLCGHHEDLVPTVAFGPGLQRRERHPARDAALDEALEGMGRERDAGSRRGTVLHRLLQADVHSVGSSLPIEESRFSGQKLRGDFWPLNRGGSSSHAM